MMVRIIVTILFLGFFSTGIYSEETPAKLPLLKNFFKTVNPGLEDTPTVEKKAVPSKKNKARAKQSKSNVISGVFVKGNTTIPSAFILQEVTVKKGDKINPYLIDRAVKNVQSLGIFSSVRSEIKKTKGQNNLFIHVTEHPTLDAIVFKGVTLFETPDLLAVIHSKEKELFNLSYIRKDIKAIEKLYRDKGYFQAKVFNVDAPEKSGDPLVFVVGEGVIDEIIITGNVKTQNFVIRRELDIEPGSVIHQKTLQQNLRRIFNLNYFSNLQPRFLPGLKPNSYKLSLDITEKETSGAFTFGGGYSPTSGFSVFSDLYWDNLFGSGQLIMLKGQFGRNTTYQFKYHNPWMWDKRKSLTFRTWLTFGELGSYNPLVSQISFRNERRKGFDVALGWPLSYDLRKIGRAHV